MVLHTLPEDSKNVQHYVGLFVSLAHLDGRESARDWDSLDSFLVFGLQQFDWLLLNKALQFLGLGCFRFNAVVLHLLLLGLSNLIAILASWLGFSTEAAL